MTRNRQIVSVALAAGLFTVTLVSARTLGASERRSRNGGIPQVLTVLEQIEDRLAVLEQVEARLAVLERELIPCTADRYREDLCAEGQTPFDLAINVCGSVGGEAKLEGKLAFESKTSMQGGAGWKEVLDVDVTVEGGIPGVVLLGGVIPIVLPSEVAVGAGGAVGLGLDGCLQLTEVAIGELIPRPQILTMLDAVEGGQEQLVMALADAISPSGDQPAAGLAAAAEPPRFDAAKLAQALQAAQTFASASFQMNDPLDVLSSPEVAALSASLPIGGRLQGILDDPQMLLPDLDLSSRNALCDRFPSSTAFGAKLDPACMFLEELPSLGAITGTFEQFGALRVDVGNLKSALEGLPEVIKTTVEEALPEIPNPTKPPPGNPFCELFPNVPFC